MIPCSAGGHFGCVETAGDCWRCMKRERGNKLQWLLQYLSTCSQRYPFIYGLALHHRWGCGNGAACNVKYWTGQSQAVLQFELRPYIFLHHRFSEDLLCVVMHFVNRGDSEESLIHPLSSLKSQGRRLISIQHQNDSETLLLVTTASWNLACLLAAGLQRPQRRSSPFVWMLQDRLAASDKTR